MLLINETITSSFWVHTRVSTIANTLVDLTVARNFNIWKTAELKLIKENENETEKLYVLTG